MRNFHTEQVVSEIFSMVFSNDDRAVIEACHLEKGWGARRILKEFPGRNWNLSFCKLSNLDRILDQQVGNKAVADQGQRLMMTLRPT